MGLENSLERSSINEVIPGVSELKRKFTEPQPHLFQGRFRQSTGKIHLDMHLNAQFWTGREFLRPSLAKLRYSS